MSWQPSASWQTLHQRAKIVQKIRRFFAARQILEVETPIMATAVAPERHIQPMTCCDGMFLLSSPETFMKRLLAAGSGAIYQMARVFRQGEAGPKHNPEFTLLEWYRPHWSYQQLMEELLLLIQEIIPNCGPATFLTFKEAFQCFAQVEPFAPLDQLYHAASQYSPPPPENLNRHELWDYLLSFIIEPQLPTLGRAVFIYNYPASQAAMARLSPKDPTVAERFEFYLDGVELANGYQELTDSEEQKKRFLDENRQREERGESPLPIDDAFLTALHEFPFCAGVAVGIDRLIQIVLKASTIQEVIAFPTDRV
ncbi:EF-P lysine aminoacylase EpmA [Magnetococcales bacterium HHB-1]